MEDIYTALGQRIRDKRKQRGQTLEELAHDAKLATSFVGQIERGERKLSVAALDRLAAALGIPLAQLFEKDGKAPRDGMERRIAALIGRLTPADLALLSKLLKLVLRRPLKRSVR